jgi:hypothetical protein
MSSGGEDLERLEPESIVAGLDLSRRRISGVDGTAELLASIQIRSPR